MIKVSIVIPVYNSSAYLENCIQSLLLQTFQNFEIWLIDDGSKDDSGKICDRFAHTDQRIHVVHTENYGAAHARKIGVNNVTGDFIYFVDSDDTLPHDSLERMVKAAQENPDSDIILGNCWDSCSLGKKTLSPKAYRKALIMGRHNIGVLVAKLFRKELFCNGIPDVPKDLIMGEDMLINIFLAFATDQDIQMVKGKKVYNYIQHDNSVSHCFKLSADYEFKFHHARLEMIPPEKHSDYMSTMILRRLRMLRRLLKQAKKEHTASGLADSPFTKELMKDIRDTKFFIYQDPHPSLWSFLKSIKP